MAAPRPDIDGAEVQRVPVGHALSGGEQAVRVQKHVQAGRPYDWNARLDHKTCDFLAGDLAQNEIAESLDLLAQASSPDKDAKDRPSRCRIPARPARLCRNVQCKNVQRTPPSIPQGAIHAQPMLLNIGLNTLDLLADSPQRRVAF